MNITRKNQVPHHIDRADVPSYPRPAAACDSCIATARSRMLQPRRFAAFGEERRSGTVQSSLLPGV
ncbi:hypothetical protein PsYK624_149470 [Phanerochaete sordida]|uniref:Uncharacterized protein n=1 Tax=Phanerochaete sordida TaxID=48140 RepID=A0A9P3LLV9_9APHY|nr:hypothetical protein PsYK624_149470 [Phanerochaete sordida]